MTRSIEHRAAPRRRFSPALCCAALLLPAAGAAGLVPATPAPDGWQPSPAVSTAMRGTVIEVTTTGDDLATNGNCTLREAVIAANTDSAVDACSAGSGADTIVLSAGTYQLSIPGTGENAAASGDLDVLDDLTIEGVGASQTVINGANLDRIFEVFLGANLTVSRLTMTDSEQTSAGSAVRIVDSSSLTLFRVWLTNSSPGAAIYVISGSQVSVHFSRIYGNQGSGIFAQTGTWVTIRNSSITENHSDGSGAGVNSNGDLLIVNSTLSGNVAEHSGGAIISGGVLRLHNATIADNVASAGATGDSSGGGLYLLATANAVAVNTIVSGNIDLTGVGHDDCFGPLISSGYNLIENTTGCTISGAASGDIYGISADLAPLASNGGGTLTHRLRAGSLAIDAGNPAGCEDEAGSPLATDQRGFVRDGACDIGGFEADSPGREPVFNDGFESE